MYKSLTLQWKRKKRDALEYLNLCTDPAIPLPTPCLKMHLHSHSHPQSACNCYCKIRVPMTRQREEIYSERTQVKSSKTETFKSGRKVPFTSAKIINDEQLDSKRSTVTLSPILSPETSAALEDVERLIENAQIKMKEICLTSGCSLPRKAATLYPDEAPFDDENDHLLYIRERVAHQFEEANGWIDAGYTKRQKFSSEGSYLKNQVTIKTKRSIDLSAPKFRTCEDCYKEFSRQRLLEIKKFDLSPLPADNSPEQNKQKEVESLKPDTEQTRKMDTCSVQIGPAINIKGKLIRQNLEDIHISPEPSFVQESQNVATYTICHHFSKKQSPRHREKIVRIAEDNNDKSSDNKLMSEKLKKKILDDCKEKRGDVDSLAKSVLNVEKSKSILEKVSEDSQKVLMDIEEKLAEKVEDLLEAELSFDSKQNTIELNLNLVETNSTKEDDKTKQKKEGEANQNVSNARSENNKVRKKREDSEDGSAKVVTENEQKQVRFDEQISEKTNSENRVELSNEELERSLKKGDEFQSQTITNGNTEQFNNVPCLKQIEMNKKHISLSNKHVEEKHLMDEERSRKAFVEQKMKKQEHFRNINECFANVTGKYCKEDEKYSKGDNYVTSSTMNSSEDSHVNSSQESDDLYNLYEPSIDEMDNILIAYDKIIENVIRSTRTIDKFLSRLERQELQMKPTANKKSLNSRPLNRKKIKTTRMDDLQYQLRIKQNTTESGTKNLDVKRGIPSNDKKHTLEDLKFNKMRQQSRNVSSVENKNNSNTKYIPPKITDIQESDDPFVVQTNLKMKNKSNFWRKTTEENSLESSGNNNNNNNSNSKIIGIKEHDERLFQNLSVKNGNFSLTSSSMCLSFSSTDPKTSDETKNSAETSKSQINDGGVSAKSSSLKLNEIGMEKRNSDYTSLHNVIPPDVLKLLEVFPQKAKVTEYVIARILQEETRFVTDKMKNPFDVNKIVPLMVNILLENLKSDVMDFNKLGSLISESATITTTNFQTIQMAENAKSDEESEKRNSQLEFVVSSNEIVEKSVLGKSMCRKNLIPNSAERLSSKKSGSVSLLKFKSNDSQSRGKSKTNSGFVETFRKDPYTNENSNSDRENDEIICNSDSDLKKDNEDNTPRSDINLQGNENNTENPTSAKAVSTIINKQNGNEEPPIVETLEENSELQNINLSPKDTVLINKTQSISKNEQAENVMQVFEVPNDLFLANNATVELRQKKNTGKIVRESDNNFLEVSSCDFLRDCISLQSSSKNLTKTPSNTAQHSRQIDKPNNAVSGGIENNNASRFNNLVGQAKILSDVYDEVHNKFLSSTSFNTNSNVLDQEYRVFNDTSARISTIESNEVEFSSDISHSEGELYMPSSSSYSLGEIRMLTKNRSDGENTDDFVDNVRVFVTKKMSTSSSESSKVK